MLIVVKYRSLRVCTERSFTPKILYFYHTTKHAWDQSIPKISSFLLEKKITASISDLFSELNSTKFEYFNPVNIIVLNKQIIFRVTGIWSGFYQSSLSIKNNLSRSKYPVNISFHNENRSTVHGPHQRVADRYRSEKKRWNTGRMRAQMSSYCFWTAPDDALGFRSSKSFFISCA